MNKTIHYCWFGGKPLPRLAKKCIKSWEKYLPDWEIKQWNESNFDYKVCAFSREAYENKKWAFVADYARVKALYDEGGIYFDTDMEVTGDISHLLEKPAFLGKESEGGNKDLAAAGVIYVAKKHDRFAKDILDFYEQKLGFNEHVMYTYAIPKVIKKILDSYSKKVTDDGVEIYDDHIFVYPKDYFYPVNFNWTEKFYSENTVMLHHYDATWTGASNKRSIMINKTFPKPAAKVIHGTISLGSRVKSRSRWLARGINSRVRTKASVHLKQGYRLQKLADNIEKWENRDYLIFSQPQWLGLSSVAKDMFGGYIPLMETNEYTNAEVKSIAKLMISADRKLIIFNGLPFGWDRIIREIRKMDKEIVLKVLHHGGDVRLARKGDYGNWMSILSLHNMGLINEIGLVKKQQAEFYARKGFRVKFVANNVKMDGIISETKDTKKHKNGKIRVGLYCSGDIEWKNAFNQIAAISLIDDVELDCVPLTNEIVGYADMLRVDITGEKNLLPREELLKRMSNNDLNMYVSFAEASPMLPLESFELGVPCVTANNHHYWNETPLEKYLIVNRPDDVMAIYSKAEIAIKNHDKVMSLYKEWKPKYDKESKKTIDEFLKV